MDNPYKRTAQKEYAGLKPTESDIEIILSEKLWDLGYRYRKNCKGILDKQNIVIMI
jgi:hypothetical protein